MQLVNTFGQQSRTFFQGDGFGVGHSRARRSHRSNMQNRHPAEAPRFLTRLPEFIRASVRCQEPAAVAG